MANQRRKNYEKRHVTLNEVVWWGLANLAVLAFTIFSWAGFTYLFKFPEKPVNFAILEKIGRIGNVTTFSPLDAPPTRSAAPEELYELFYGLAEDKVENFNQMLKRGYITNYEKIPVYRYLEGEFRIIETRPLTKEDFISPGLLIKARAFVKADKNSLSSPYPLVIDYVIPTKVENVNESFQVGDQLVVKKSLHCASIVNVQKEGKSEDPTLRCAIIPLAYNVYISPDKTEVPLHRPDKINVDAPFPMFGESTPAEEKEKSSAPSEDAEDVGESEKSEESASK